LIIWDGEDFSVLHTIGTGVHTADDTGVHTAGATRMDLFRLAVYEEPISGSTRLVTG
jgi:hypothetical protein